jgi:hypothetical protein
MGISTRNIKVSDLAEKTVAFKLGVPRVAFKRVKYVKPFVIRFTFFVYDFYGFVGTANFIWDLRKILQLIVLRNIDTSEIIMVRHFNDPQVKGFFPPEI